MKASRFNVVEPAPDGGAVIQNTLYGSRTACRVDDIERLRAALADPDAPGCAGSDVLECLVRQRQVVEDVVDELAIVRARKRAGVEDTNRLDVIVMPTLDCNFACPYCYERRMPSRMSDRTEDALRRWLEGEIPRHKVTLLSWFGGEPLLGYRSVLSITRHAVKTAKQSGVGCLVHMTTNGSLLTPARARELADAGLLDFQITIDGSREFHDAFRPTRAGAGTFELLVRNVVALVDTDPRVNVSLRTNFNHLNLHSIPELLTAFPEHCRPQLRPVFEPIFGSDAVSATANLPADVISAALADDYALAASMGYNVVHGRTDLSAGRLVYCYAERENQVVVNFNGDVFKCSVADFSAEPRFGYIRADGVLVKEPAWDAWMGLPLFDDRCESCVYLPTCMGGCRKDRLHHGATGSACALVPTNASYLLKQLAFGPLHRYPSDESMTTP